MNQPAEPMSVKMETKLVVKIAGCTHHISFDEARALHSKLHGFIISSSEAKSAGAQKVRDIQSCVIAHFGLHRETFASRARPELYAWPRLIAMALASEMVTQLNRSEIGYEFGRERSLVSYATLEVAQRISVYPDKRAEVEAIRAKLNGNGGAQ